MNIEGRYTFPSLAVKLRPTVRGSIGRTGKISSVTASPGRTHHPTGPVTVVGDLVIRLVVGQLVGRVPALGALMHPQDPGPLRSWWATRFPRRAARQDDRGCLTANPVHQPTGQWPHAPPRFHRHPRDHALVPLHRPPHPP